MKSKTKLANNRFAWQLFDFILSYWARAHLSTSRKSCSQLLPPTDTTSVAPSQPSPSLGPSLWSKRRTLRRPCFYPIFMVALLTALVASQANFTNFYTMLVPLQRLDTLCENCHYLRPVRCFCCPKHWHVSTDVHYQHHQQSINCSGSVHLCYHSVYKEG